MLPTTNTNQTIRPSVIKTTTAITNRTTRPSVIKTTTGSTKKDAAQDIEITSVKPSPKKVKTVNLVITTTSEFARHNLPQSAQPCFLPFVSVDENYGTVKHSCALTKDRHLHSVKFMQNIPVANSPIPPKAKELIQAVEFHESVGELGFTGKQTTAALYKNNKLAQVPCSTIDNQSSLKQTCTIQGDYHIHSTTKPIFVHSNDIPIPAPACGYRQHFAYAPNKDVCHPPRYWEKLDEHQKSIYIKDIVDCYNRDATRSMIARRHKVLRRNIMALLKESGTPFREGGKESELGQYYRVDRAVPISPKMQKLTIAPLKEALSVFYPKGKASTSRSKTATTATATSAQSRSNSETLSSKAPLLSEMLKSSAQPIFSPSQQAVRRPVSINSQMLEEPLAKRPKSDLDEKNSANQGSH